MLLISFWTNTFHGESFTRFNPVRPDQLTLPCLTQWPKPVTKPNNPNLVIQASDPNQYFHQKPLLSWTNLKIQTESLKGACESKPGETEILMGYVVYDDENCDGTNDTLASDLKNLIDINQVEN